ncbi:MAG: aminoacetone oxidase family FAD-binding enzyme [Ruminiclostridium sp.]|nr:aminoacetone oxidase family FAD-binding enzyme [Ruminiclostridium sp.]
MKKYDIAVIGGGASGLAAAINAKRTDKSLSVAVIERLPRVGKKILATGNGRCNLSNNFVSTETYTGTCKSLLSSTEKFSVSDFFYSLGVICETDGAGRIYPRCHSAASVLDALRLECARLGVEEICDTEVSGIDRKNISGYLTLLIKDSDEKISAKKMILAGGGMSQSALGSNGSILDICRGLGIEMRPLFPCLVPFRTEPKLVKPLKGQRADADVMFYTHGKCVQHERGEVQFTDGLVSGICVFDLSYLYNLYSTESEVRIDLLPDISETAVTELLKAIRQTRPEASSADFLSGIFTRTLGAYIIKRALKDPPEKTADINDNMIKKTAAIIKMLAFPILGTAGFERSQLTGGGIIADELYDTFELKKIKGLYACGELLDIYGRCGGFNLDFAFSSGAIAGKNAALGMRK